MLMTITEPRPVSQRDRDLCMLRRTERREATHRLLAANCAEIERPWHLLVAESSWVLAMRLRRQLGLPLDGEDYSI